MVNRFSLLFAVVFLLIGSESVVANENTNNKSILVSIAPLHSIVSIITRGVQEPELLMSANSSPHDFQLKPSQRRKINQANLFVWVGESLETVLDGLVHIDGLDLFGLEQYGNQLNLLSIREDEIFGQVDSHDHEHEHDHGESDYDPHFWMAPDNMLRFSSSLTQFLMGWDPVNANVYQQNYFDFMMDMKTKASEWETDLSPYRDNKILSSHDGFQYFEKVFGFHHVASMQTNTNVALSIKRLDTLNSLIKSQQVTCLFTEPQVPDRMVQSLVRRNDIELASLDVLGNNLAIGGDLYFNLMDNNIQSIIECYE